MTRACAVLTLVVFHTLVIGSTCSAKTLQAGAAVVDVTPQSFPVLVNGGMTSRTASEVTSPINARAIVLDDGQLRIGIVVVDSCMMGRPFLDEVKLLASRQTQLPPHHILISATHTHTAPSAMGALGTDADPDYLPVLRAGIVEALQRAEANLEPAEVGWAITDAADFTAVRRWIRRPDRVEIDPFGNPTVRANMHAAKNLDNVTGESGPEDPDLALISFRSPDGRLIAVLANFSMHYFSGQKPLAADYFGLFCNGLEERLGHQKTDHPPFVAVMSHGCSGDIWRRDYRMPPDQQIPFASIEDYSSRLVDVAMTGLKSVTWSTEDGLAMQEARRELNYRVPDQQRLEWARRMTAELGDRLPKTRPEIYAREQVLLHERQSTEVVVQALRIGDIGIATTPCETYALTGLKLKRRSPLKKTIVIELANGGDGYIPPPEQHFLGGYNTWAARSAGLEVQAEPIIVETALELLETVSGKSRQSPVVSMGEAANAVNAAKPIVWWRLDEMQGPWALDHTGHQHHAVYEPGVAFYLDGRQENQITSDGHSNRAAHFAGGRLLSPPVLMSPSWTVSMWIWNGMPTDARPVTGWMYSQGRATGSADKGLHLGLGGTDNHPGQLICLLNGQQTAGTATVARWQWNHVVMTCDGTQLQVYLNGNLDLETDWQPVPVLSSTFLGGRCDNQSNWEGRLDEIAIFDRVLQPDEVNAIGGQPVE